MQLADEFLGRRDSLHLTGGGGLKQCGLQPPDFRAGRRGNT
jgi:hypothetical protein